MTKIEKLNDPEVIKIMEKITELGVGKEVWLALCAGEIVKHVMDRDILPVLQNPHVLDLNKIQTIFDIAVREYVDVFYQRSGYPDLN